MHRKFSPHFIARPVLPVLASLGLLACSGSVADDSGPMGSSGSPTIPGAGNAGSPTIPGAGSGNMGTGGASNPGGGAAPVAGGANPSGGTPGTECTGTGLAAAKRVVRLSFNQIANSIGTMINAALGTTLAETFELVDAQHRAFPPLQSPREGNSLTDLSWSTVDQIAQAAGKYVLDNFATVTNCGATPTDMCAQTYLTNLAQKAYRRPLTADEQMRLTTLYTTGLKGQGATIQEAVQHGVYAILQTPQFLYRTEFGADVNVDGPLSQTELASMLSFFLTDNSPDQPLLEAAAQNKLSTPAEVGAQVDRILATDAAKTNLHGAMMSYFAYPGLETVVIQDTTFTGPVRLAMYREAEAFLKNALWNAPLSELLVGRKTYVNADLAKIYGITQFPPPGAMLDANMFAQVDLPANRTGLLTQAGFLANRSRPNETSVVGRGLLIKNSFLCTETPGPPEGVQDAIEEISMQNPNASERELADIRASMALCNACHATFDAYGLAIDTYDMIGRFRDKDHEGRPYDTTVTLPEQVGGGMAKDILEVAQKIDASGGFAKCMGRNLMNYALADTSAGAAEISSCAVSQVAQSFAGTDKTFSSLVKAVATSNAFANRSKGVAQ